MRQLMHRARSRATSRGLTLIELVVGLAIASLLALTAAPYFADYGINSRLREAGNLVLTEALLAQSEAIKRNRTVRLTTAGASVQVFDLADPANPVLMRQRTLAGGVSAETRTVDFGAEGRPVNFAGESINLSLASVTCSNDLRCPRLRIDGGGALRLCGNQLSCV